MSIVGISIIEIAPPSAQNDVRSVDRVCMVGFATPAETTNINKLVGVSSYVDFTTKYPTGVSETVLADVRVFFRNAPDRTLYFFAANDPAIAGSPNDKGHIVYALTAIGKRYDLRLHILVIPDIVNLTVQSERTALFSLADSICQKLGWLYFHNTAASVDTKDEALTERALYSSPFGHSALYYGLGVDPEKKNPTVATIAAAIALRRFRDSPYAPPAGPRYPIQGIDAVVGYIDFNPDVEELRDRGINVIQDIRGYKFCIWGARTLCTNPKIAQINTRIANSDITRKLEFALLPMMFEPSDPRGFTRDEVIRLIVSVLEEGYTDGALSGASPQEAYRVVQVEVPITVSPDGTTKEGANNAATNTTPTETTATATTAIVRNLRRVQILVYARFVEALEMIEIKLINVDIIPSSGNT